MRKTPRARASVVVLDVVERRFARLASGRHVLVPALATFEAIEPSDDFPSIEIVVDVHDGRLVVTSARLIGTREHPLTSDAVRAWSLPKLAAQAVTSLFAEMTEDGGFELTERAEPAETIVRAVRKRETVSTERLSEIADVFNRNGIEAVTETFFVSRSQAYRLVGKAREAGLVHTNDGRTR